FKAERTDTAGIGQTGEANQHESAIGRGAVTEGGDKAAHTPATEEIARHVHRQAIRGLGPGQPGHHGGQYQIDGDSQPEGSQIHRFLSVVKLRVARMLRPITARPASDQNRKLPYQALTSDSSK